MGYADAVSRGSVERIPRPVRRGVRVIAEWFPLVIVAGLWEVISGNAVNEETLPPPSEVFSVAIELLAGGEILPHLEVSLVRVAIGLGLSILVGVSLGVGMARWQPVEYVFDVPLALLYPIPKTALVPLAILWLSNGTEIAIVIVFLACLLPIVMNSYNAAEDVDENLVRSARMMGTGEKALVYKVVIPDSVPEILTGVRQAIPFAFIALVSAEFIAADTGVGAEILRHGQVGNYPSMFAVVVIVTGTAYLIARAFESLRAYAVSWT